MSIADDQLITFVYTLQLMCIAEGWTYLARDDDKGINHYGQVEVEPGLRLYFQSSKEGKVHVSGVHYGLPGLNPGETLSSFIRHGESYVGINLSVDKGHTTITADLKRRIIPQLREELGRLWGRRQHQIDFETSVSARTTELMAVWPRLIRWGHRQDRMSARLHFSLDGREEHTYGDVIVFGTSVQFDRFYCSLDIAKKIIQLLKEEAR